MSDEVCSYVNAVDPNFNVLKTLARCRCPRFTIIHFDGCLLVAGGFGTKLSYTNLEV